MQVTLVKYTGKQNIANKKFLDNWHEITSQEVTTYGSFNPNAASFRLDILYDANYAVYVFNGHDYYGYVDIEVDSNGLYAYKISIDPLTTCWYAGCFTDYENICLYSKYGDLIVKDPRANDDPELIWTVNSYQNNSTDYVDYYVMIAICNGEGERNSGKPAAFQTPGFDTYILDTADFSKFLQKVYKLEEEVDGSKVKIAAKYIPCITNIMFIPKYEIDPTLWEPIQTGIYLYSPTTDDRTTVVAVERKILPASDFTVYGNYYGDWNKPDYNQGQYSINFSDAPFYINSDNIDGILHLQVPGYGAFDIRLSDIADCSPITQIGYIKRYDIVSGNVKTILTINNITYPDYSFVSKCPLSIPIMYDNVLTDWTSLRASIAVSALNLALSTGVSAFGILAGGPIGGAAGLLGVAGSASSLVNSGTAMHRQETQDASYAGVQQGNIGGTPESYELPWCTIKYRKSHNMSDIQSLYGKPDGKKRILANCTGYIQTADCQLSQEYLPKDVVSQAQSMCNAGFNIAY